MISAIIVAYNEAEYIRNIIKELRTQQFQGKVEIILADGGSSDNTVSIAKKEGILTINCQKGKAFQMNEGAKAARGNILFFVHADMLLPEHVFLKSQQTIAEGVDGGGFSNIFDQYNEKIKRLGTWMNFCFFDKREQSDKGIFFGDNGIFVKKKVFEDLRGFKEIPIMEDYDFSIRMNQKYTVKKIKNPKITVSARRHLKAGFVKTRFQWIMIRQLYKLGFPPKLLAKWYKDVR